MPGVSHVVAQTLVAEIGVDMERFPTPGHLRSWVGLCPRLDESAGKRRSTRIRHGAPWLKTVLVQAAWTAVRNRDGYPHAQYQRLKARRGAKKAIVAVAASLLTAAYFILRDEVEYRDLGAQYFDRRNVVRAANRFTKRLEGIPYQGQGSQCRWRMRVQRQTLHDAVAARPSGRTVRDALDAGRAQLRVQTPGAPGPDAQRGARAVHRARPAVAICRCTSILNRGLKLDAWLPQAARRATDSTGPPTPAGSTAPPSGRPQPTCETETVAPRGPRAGVGSPVRDIVEVRPQRPPAPAPVSTVRRQPNPGHCGDLGRETSCC